ncbi:hypothetical protein RFI_11736, partial [Reticulomyxa filosa]
MNIQIQKKKKKRDQHLRDDLLGVVKVDCSSRFKEIYGKAEMLKERAIKGIAEEEQKEENVLHYEFSDTLALRIPGKEAKGVINIHLSCQILFPLNTEVRLARISRSCDQLNANIRDLEQQIQNATQQKRQHEISLQDLEEQEKKLQGDVANLENEKKNLNAKVLYTYTYKHTYIKCVFMYDIKYCNNWKHGEWVDERPNGTLAQANSDNNHAQSEKEKAHENLQQAKVHLADLTSKIETLDKEATALSDEKQQLEHT